MKKINFKSFLYEAAGNHGEYPNDVAEKTMVNEIIRLLMNGVKDEKNYATAYSFIEWEGAKDFYDKYYDAWEERASVGKSRKTSGEEKLLSPESAKLIGEFRKELPVLFAKWKKQK